MSWKRQLGAVSQSEGFGLFGHTWATPAESFASITFTLEYWGKHLREVSISGRLCSYPKHTESFCFEAKEPSRGQTWDRAGRDRTAIRGYLWGSQDLRHASEELRDF